MVEADNVEVYLVRHDDGTRYSEHAVPPGTPKYTGDPNERYVQVKTDERFEIVVRLLSGFKFLDHPKVRVEFHLDKGHHLRQTLSRRKRPQHLSSSDRSHRETNLRRIRRFINGEWMSCGLTFGSLESGMS
jgi:hypothetical protein